MCPNPLLTTSTSTAKYVATTVEHPRLLTFNTASICIFFRTYDQYATEIRERARHLVVQEVITTVAITSTNHEFSVNADWLNSLIVFGFISDVPCYENLADRQPRTILEQKAQKYKEVATLNILATMSLAIIILT